MQQTAPTKDVHQLTAKVQQLQQQLIEAQKMTAMGELVSSTTHEFNNVLMTIINYAKIGLRHKDEATRDKALDQILTAAKRAEKITNSVLGMARNRSSDVSPTDLVALLDETLVLLEREMHKHRITVQRHIDPQLPKITVCGNQIQQVLLNLLTNARQAMPQGGMISVGLQYHADEDCVEIMVRDTGSGIPREQLPRIFDRYYSTKQGPDASGKGGTGVGLATCRDIIDAHQGRIRVESTLGQGTSFAIRLPRTA